VGGGYAEAKLFKIDPTDQAVDGYVNIAGDSAEQPSDNKASLERFCDQEYGAKG
jgi:hypothetical protein